MHCKCKVEQRRLTPGVFNLKQFLNGSETMVWEIDNCIINDGTCDLNNYDAFLTLSIAGEIDEIMLTKRQTGGKLQLLWDVGTYATALTGYVKYQIAFRSANFDTLGVIADDPEANGVYPLVNQDTAGNARVFQQAENGYQIKWDAGNGRWALYQADGATVVDYQTTPNTEPHCGYWGNIAVGNNEAAAWISDEAIMYISESIAADQKVTGNYPTILRQLWAKLNKSGVTSVNGKTGIVELSPPDIGAAEDEHTHEIKDIINLQENLNGKAAKDHSHSEFAEIKNKADKGHTHKIADTEGLQNALDGKAPTEHGHTISNVNGLPAALTNVATKDKLGHVKVDDETIKISEDGTIKASVGLPIGSIFPFPASIPPEGAYLLNGQTIANCRGLYPKFWEWLTDNAGDMIATPVYKAWTMPALTANGTLGGSEYAAEASGAVTSGHDAYKSFDGTHGGSKTFAGITDTTSGWLTWYSPVKLKVTSLIFQNPSSGTANRYMSDFEIFGSNDGVQWDSLVSGTMGGSDNSYLQTVKIPENKYNVDKPGYHYLKIEAVNGGGINMDFPEITIYGQEYIYTDYSGNGNILTMSNDAYEYTLARTGVCGGFVIDSATGNVRLPRWHYQSPLGETLPVRGNGRMTIGLTNGVDNFGMGHVTNVGLQGSTNTYGIDIGDDRSVSGYTPTSNYTLGLTTDPDKSGIVAETNAPADQFYWCIQVYNAATALSEQESAQLASQMQTRMQTDMSNGSKATQNAVDGVMPDAMDYVIESWKAVDGSSWYRKYRSGWVEQGGHTSTGATADVITLPVEFADTDYTVLVASSKRTTTDTDTGGGQYIPTVGSYTTTSFRISRTSANPPEWEAKGYAATE